MHSELIIYLLFKMHLELVIYLPSAQIHLVYFCTNDIFFISVDVNELSSLSSTGDAFDTRYISNISDSHAFFMLFLS